MIYDYECEYTDFTYSPSGLVVTLILIYPRMLPVTVIAHRIIIHIAHSITFGIFGMKYQINSQDKSNQESIWPLGLEFEVESLFIIPHFVADHPFVYVIKNKSDVVFMGRQVNYST